MGLLPCTPRVALVTGGVAMAVMFAGAVCSACSGGASHASQCVSGLSAACAPLYPPTFDQIYTRTLTLTCAQPGAFCHSGAGAQGGLSFVTEDSAYALLLGTMGGAPQVIPGDPSCSPLVERLDSTDPTQLMPPGAELSSAERCAIFQWIAEGAMP
jgi:hypothetical protein